METFGVFVSLWSFGIFNSHLAHLYVWLFGIISHFGMLCHQKSGDPGQEMGKLKERSVKKDCNDFGRV
jgi:hypothetical protein